MEDHYMLTNDVLNRFKISRKTLFHWRNSEKMPKGFACPFPAPDLPGNPNRWRTSTIEAWEDKTSQKH
ncbi:AlpA family transcriptional regulator [Pantoea sp. At-9b]|uniref:helix-turn-helix transcriptional regulator n=1 Tax=Pantoea sp. (strain At-9b) TaxID=592316 RepID=UPI0001B3F50A|nr:hypothetical protein [Pantoea sp. At-9b]ADU69478.1 excisionase [Pantoea sp. At-9b]